FTDSRGRAKYFTFNFSNNPDIHDVGNSCYICCANLRCCGWS
ncbi:unnamed protein product, partial [Allacma fusca]